MTTTPEPVWEASEDLTDEVDKRTFTAAERRRLARSGAAMSDGSFPIANVSDLRNAIQAVGRAKNRSSAIAHIKRRARALGRTDLVENLGKSASWQVDIPISKVDEEQHIVFGWAYVPHPVAKEDGGELGPPKVDLQDQYILLEDLEKAAYDYVEFYGEGDVMHTAPVTAHIVESMVFTPEKMAKMGVEWDGPWGWWIGHRVDEDTWAGVRSGVLKMFSIYGEAHITEE